MQVATYQRPMRSAGQLQQQRSSQLAPRPSSSPIHGTARSAAIKAAAAAATAGPSSNSLFSLASLEPFAAASDNTLQLPLSSIADMRRQVGSDLDDFFSASPFSTMRRFDDMMEQQFQQMDPFGGGSSFSRLNSLPDRMQQQMQEMDRQMDRAFADMDRVQQQLDAELARNLRQLQEQQQPGVRIERREEKSPGSYRYYESIQIRSGVTGYTALTPAHSTALFNPLLLAALIFAGAYAAVTAAFARNFDLTTYAQHHKWKLLLLWPVLAPFSKPFRQQFSSALRGEQVRVQQDDGVDGSSSSSSSSNITNSS